MSSARSRQQRRNRTTKNERMPGVLRGGLGELRERTVGHGVRRGGEFNWRAISGMMVISLSFVLGLFFVTDFFYVRTVEVAGANYLDESEVFRYADIAEAHIFWVNPDDVRANIIEASPVIADAQVSIRWPPNAVRIVVEEREPAIIWIQAGVTALVDVHGRVLRFPREGIDELPQNLIRINALDGSDGPPGGNVLVDTGAINGALQLQVLLPGIQGLSYDATNGLGFREAGGWDVWLGTGTDMRNKLLVYEGMVENLQLRGIIPTEINVADLERGPHYCCQQGLGQ